MKEIVMASKGQDLQGQSQEMRSRTNINSFHDFPLRPEYAADNHNMPA